MGEDKDNFQLANELSDYLDEIEREWNSIKGQRIHTQDEAFEWSSNFISTATAMFGVYSLIGRTKSKVKSKLLGKVTKLLNSMMSQLHSYAKTLKPYGLETYTVSVGVSSSISLTFKP